MTGTCFVDTNVFLYAHDQAVPEKATRARLWTDELWRKDAGRVSFQVLHEFYTNVVKKQSVQAEMARRYCRSLLEWHPLVPNGELLESAWRIGDRFGFNFWDSMIVAAAQRAECKYLLTEDLQDGQELEGVRVISPFRHEPESLLH